MDFFSRQFERKAILLAGCFRYRNVAQAIRAQKKKAKRKRKKKASLTIKDHTRFLARPNARRR